MKMYSDYIKLLCCFFIISFSKIAFAQYNPSYVNSNGLDLDGDSVVDYKDIDDDQDGITDIVEGCTDFDIENTIGADGTALISGSSYSLVGTTVTYTHTLSQFEKVESELLSPTQGYGIKVREDVGSASGNLTVTLSPAVDNLFFKLVDFDQDESWTVHVYDELGNDIPLTTGNTTNGLYMMGEQVELLAGQTFHDASGGTGPNPYDDAKFDNLNAAYFYFPTKKVSQIVFDISHPTNGAMRFTGMQYCPTDTDGDGLTDDRDNDSDADGIPDLVEAGGTDSDGDGVASGVDTDQDGLVDQYDNYESSMTATGDCSGTNATPHIISFATSKVVTNDVGISFYITGDYDLNSGSPANQETLDYQIDDGAGGWTTIESKLKLGAECTEVFYMKDSPLPISAAVWNTASADGLVQFRFVPSVKVDTDGGANSCPPSCLGDVTVYFTEAGANGSSIPDYDSDSDGVKDRVDIDSDDDGITDNTEALATASYVALSGTDSDGDGIDDSYDVDSGFTDFAFVDTDSDGTPDYLDTDSDGTEEPDNIEGHDTNGDGVVDGSDSPNANTGIYVGTDSDGDGLDDGYDNNNSGFSSTNSSLQPTSHPIFDGGSDRDWRSTKSTASLDFDGVDDHIDYGDVLDLTSSFTLEAWVLQEQSIANGTIISKGNVKSGSRKGYTLSIINNYPNLTWYNSGGILKVDITSPYAISNDRWYHIAASYDGSTAKLYIDGVLVGTDTSTGPPGDITEKCIIGAAYDSDTPSTPKYYFDGYIDEVRVWNVALSANQLHEMMNQEIEQNGTAVRGKVIPLDISGGLLWTNLDGYYDMNNDDADDKSSHSRNGTPKNITTLEQQTAPLPYTTKADGDWSDTSSSTPWTYGDSVWNAPNSIGVDGTTPIDWNIVVTDHNVNIGTYTSLGREREVLGLLVNTNKLTVNGDDASHTGNGLTVSNYLKLDGAIDLEGESQLIQTSGSILDVTSSGTLEKDQQGTKDLYTYNYWSSPVGVSNTTSNNNSYTVPNVLKDGTNPASPATITFMTSGYNGTTGPPISIADYWIWKYANQIADTYSAWQHVRSTGVLSPGQGFTMKGVSDTSGNITLQQNYVLHGKPNNGDITLTIAKDNDYLVGNPYASALDADEFIKDNISNLETNGRNTNGNIINGVLYFWDHFASSTHILREYEGGYATYTLMGGNAAICTDARINATGQSGTKIPERYVPVGQGFFVSAVLDASLVGLSQPVDGGSILFKNSQRIFKKETVTGTNTGSVFIRSTGSSKEKTSAEKTTEIIKDPRQKIRLMFDSPSGYHRGLLVGVDVNASNDFDIGYDAPLIESNKEDMYWQFDDSKFTIQAVNNFDEDQVLPIGIETSKDGLSTIKIESLENIDNATEIYVHDKASDSYYDLRASNFQIYLPTGNYTDRFEITFSTNSENKSLDIPENELNAMVVYYSNDSESIVLNNPNLVEIKNIELLNILGQSILSIDNIVPQNIWGYKVKNLSSGTYVLKMNTVSGSVSKKVLVK